jgi:ribonuclease-3
LPAPTYRVVELRGAPHEQVFEVEVYLGDRPVARGEGRSKRLAERAAAVAALAQLTSANA